MENILIVKGSLDFIIITDIFLKKNQIGLTDLYIEM